MTGSSPSIRINGAGPTGSLLAIGLAKLGYSIDLFDPLCARELCSKSRAYALTHSSRRLLIDLGLWNELKPFMVPFKSLRIEDCGTNRRVRFTPKDLHPSNSHTNTIGWILDHQSLMPLILQKLEQNTLTSLCLGKKSDRVKSLNDEYNLVIAADGPRSSTRTNSKLPFWSHHYSQGCLTAKVHLREVNPEEAYECFRPEGPLALLPLGSNDFQVVWSAPIDRCRRLASLESSAFLDQLATILPCGLEPDALLDAPGSFPLELSISPKLHRDNIVLVGESGHRCHPVGGQGLNLCWRDVDTLLKLMSSTSHLRLGIRDVPRLYTMFRFLDLFTVGLATDCLVRLFSNRQPGLLLIRRVGLSILRRSTFFRRVSLQVMSDGPGTLLKRLPE